MSVDMAVLDDVDKVYWKHARPKMTSFSDDGCSLSDDSGMSSL